MRILCFVLEIVWAAASLSVIFTMKIVPKTISLLTSLALATLVVVPQVQAASVVKAKQMQDARGKWALVPLADGFDFPVGKPNGEGFYKSRGLRLKSPRHLGEDWNGNGGGNTDLGAPVYTIGDGVVTYAEDAKGRWGKNVIVRHAFRDPKSGKVLCCQTLYSHLHDISVELGQLVRRGERVGSIGTGNGQFPAHLHFELHYDIDINCGHQGVAKNQINYGNPTEFIERFRKLRVENRLCKVPIGGFIPYKGTEGL